MVVKTNNSYLKEGDLRSRMDNDIRNLKLLSKITYLRCDDLTEINIFSLS